MTDLFIGVCQVAAALADRYPETGADPLQGDRWRDSQLAKLEGIGVSFCQLILSCPLPWVWCGGSGGSLGAGCHGGGCGCEG